MIPLVALAAANVVASLQKETKPFTLSEIVEATAEEYGIPTVRLLGKGCESVQEEARRVALYLSAKVASPEEIATFFGCDVSRIEVPEGDARMRMNRIANRLKDSHKVVHPSQGKDPVQRKSTSSPVLADWFPALFEDCSDETSRTSHEMHCFVKRSMGRWSQSKQGEIRREGKNDARV